MVGVHAATIARSMQERFQIGGRGGREVRSGAAPQGVRSAWPQQTARTSRARRQRPRQTSWNNAEECEKEANNNNRMWPRASRGESAAPPAAPAPAAPGASPGLLRRRYSAPETVMRKYRLEQLSAQESNRTVEACSCMLSEGERARGPAGAARRERDAVRRSALLRRMHGRAACACRCAPVSRSLNTSRSELRSSSSGSASSGRTSSKKLRLETATPLSRLGEPTSTELVLTDSLKLRDAVSFTDTDVLISSTSESNYRDVTDADVQYSGISDTTTNVGAESTDGCSDGNSFVDSSDTFSTSLCTTRNTLRTVPSLSNVRTNNIDPPGNIVPYESPLTVKTPSYDILEIVVSESLDTMYTSGSNVTFSEKTQKRLEKKSPEKYKQIKNVTSENIDEYVSNMLVESLNSLSDQLESMNASIGANGKLNIIEKEIKIKLQNTGVNTIVHLSPTSNNQIIFGHEELCSSDERQVNCAGPVPGALSPAIRDVPASAADTDPTSADSAPGPARPQYPQNSFTNLGQSDSVNKAVLQQIQKLFQDDLQLIEPDDRYSNESIPSISHIEISKADVYMHDEPGTYSTTTEAMEKPMSSETSEVISGIGAGNYYENIVDNAIVPRFSAFPHTESMEVNTSSSEDPDVLGSECTSLVDSLDDPNSPRSLMLRKSASKRSELVRSSIDILDLLPENAYRTESAASKQDKGEAFFVTIKDDNCECDREKKDIVVADHMPETIKQRLYRRHKKRELRMECARRSKVKQIRRELEKQRHSEFRKSKKEMERQCMSLIKSLIDDIITKIVHNEFKCMRIKQKSVVMVSAKSDESLSNNWKKDVELINHCKKLSKSNTSQSCSEGMNKKYRKEKFQIRGKLSLQAYPSLTPTDSNSKRIYQKSEIHDGKKCIEILEIVEYASSSASSPDTCNSDDNQCAKLKKSRIPVPVSERISSQKTSKSSAASSQSYLNNMSANVYSPTEEHKVISRVDARSDSATAQALRRSAVPHCEPRSRSNSLRFKRVFDMIPEEKCSVIVEPGSEDHMYSRRASAPTLVDGPSHSEEEIELRISQFSIGSAAGNDRVNSNPDLTIKRDKETRSAGTSPMPNSAAQRSVLTQTSALASSSSPNRSAATSPIRNMTMSTQTLSPRRKSIPNQYPKAKVQQQVLPQSLQYRREQPRRPQPPPQGTARSCAPPPLAHATASSIPVE